MGVALRSSDGHPVGCRDLLERQTERVLQHDDARLVGRKRGQAAVQLSAQLGAIGFTRRIRVGSSAPILEQWLAGPSTLAVGDITTRVHGQPVQPRCELRLSAKLPDLDAEFRQRLLRRVSRVLGIAQEMTGKLLDPRRMALTERREGSRVAVFCSFHQNRIAQPCVDQRPLRAEGLLNWTAAAPGQLHVRL